MADKTLEDICGDMADAPKIRLTTKKMLKGHINKVNSVHYSGDSRCVILESYTLILYTDKYSDTLLLYFIIVTLNIESQSFFKA